GAPLPVSVGGRALGLNAPARVEAGSLVEFGTPVLGVRSYLAVRGGLSVEPVLGSGSTDLLSGLGPPALSPGDLIPTGSAHVMAALSDITVDVAPVPPLVE